jgi:hypothetical protein
MIQHLSEDIFNLKLNLFTAIDVNLQRTIFVVGYGIAY